MTCEKCNLELPDHLVFKCDGHCQAVLCIRHIKTHALEATMTHRHIPRMVKNSK